ncbi:MAG: FAD-binding oxidoreductase [Desulfobacterales bacterium]|jgi:alkyldihydroxyacetonephosphate synthase
MLRWNGWGDESVSMQIPPNGLKILEDLIGEGRKTPDAPLERMLARIPDSRLPKHPLISTDRKLRLDHAHGQSLPDWIALRFGTLQRFPDGVAMPTTIEEVRQLLKFATDNDVVVISFGGGTSVVGHLDVPEIERPVLSLSLERLNRLIDLDGENLLATFEPGIRGPEIETQLNSRGFTLGHFPQSFEFSSLGGWVVTRSCGQQSSHYGRIEKLFVGGEILTPRGSWLLPPTPASAAGPDLRQLVLGSEGRMGILTRITVKISRLPEVDTIYGVFFPSWRQGHDAVKSIAGSDIGFSMIRLSNPTETTTNLAIAGHKRRIGLLMRYLRMRGICDAEACMCLIGFTGSRRMTSAARRDTLSIVRRHKGVMVGQAIGNAWKKNRFRSAYFRNTLWDLGYAVDTLETAITWDKVTEAIEAIENSLHNALQPWHEAAHVFTHLSHVYPIGSSIYTTFLFRLAESSQEMIEKWKSLKQSASQAIVEAGGTISHQHGVGNDHRRYLAVEKGAIGLGALLKFFDHIDPYQRMNPNKLLP